IIALGLANELTATEMLAMYIDRGQEIFPPAKDNWLGWLKKQKDSIYSQFLYRYNDESLSQLLNDVFGNRLLRESNNRLCIPSFEGKFSEVYIFKTPHHPDYQLDATEKLTTVARATSAAPTLFRSLDTGDYTFVDGGIWCNNPIMIGVVDAMTCYNVLPERIRILSIGCGDSPYYVHDKIHMAGGKWHWREVIFAAMHLQSQNALGQAGLLIEPENLLRVSPPTQDVPIKLDDWQRASTELPKAAEISYRQYCELLRENFFKFSKKNPIFY
ncbi:MAG: patatin-like phospholipase family protein, partial [Planctomycetes bacterium]|nr:patatin-like phospholipase family protein [Planctomycetota bacterium]